MDQEQNSSVDGSGETLESEPAVSTGNATPESQESLKPPRLGGIRNLLKRFNLYLLIFIFILIVAGVIIFIAFSQSKKQSTNTPKSTGLSNATLQQIANSDASVGGPQQVLNVESNAVFAGKVLVNQSLSVAGGLQVSGNVGFQDINSSGNAQLQSANILKDLSVGGNLGISGNATINQSLQVKGTGTFTGTVSASQLTTGSLQLSGDLVLNHHLSVGGSTPSSTSGGALGSGGTASVSGSDTSGAISINIGSGPSSGCFATIKFSQAYNKTPYVLVSPVGQSAAGLSFYVTSATTSFNLCVASAAPANSSFSFDYFVVD